MESLARLVVVQDSGLRAKTPLFDSQNRVARDSHHTPAELASFIFGGSGMAMSEHIVSVKIHYLPALPALPASVLISRLFSIDPSFHTKHQQPNTSRDWAPEPLLDYDEVPVDESFSTRFAIGVVLPISDSFESLRDTITENWLQISNSLLMIQMLVISKLRTIHLTSNTRLRKPKSQHFSSSLTQAPHQSVIHRSSLNDVGGLPLPLPLPLNVNSSNSMKRLNFTKYCIQSEIDIHHTFISFTKMIYSLTKTPRLFYNLKYSNQTLVNWATNLSTWIALKDSVSLNPSTGQGYQNQTHFLVFMLSILLPVRDKFFLDPLSSDESDIIRLVIGTGNPVISEKLIFILSGLLGYANYGKLFDELNQLLELSSRSNSNISMDYTHNFSNMTLNGNGLHKSNLTNNMSLFKSISEPLEFKSGDGNNHSFSKPIPMNLERPSSPYSYGAHGKSLIPLSPSTNSKGWSPSLSQSYKLNESEKVSISSKSGLSIHATHTHYNVVLPSSPSEKYHHDEIAHSKSIPIKGISAANNETAQGLAHPQPYTEIQRSSSYASLQNISESYGANTPTSSVGASSSWRNMGSWIDRWKWGGGKSPRQNSKGSLLGSSFGRTAQSSSFGSRLVGEFNGSDKGDTPSPGFGPHIEDEWDGNAFDSNYLNNSKRLAAGGFSPAKSTASESSSETNSRFKSSGIGSFGFGVNYRCKAPEANVERSVGNLKTIKYEKLTKSIEDFVHEIMDSPISEENIQIETHDLGATVAKLSYPNSNLMKSQMETISSTTIIRLPMLVGFIPEYHSEFTLMSCPVTNPSVANGVAGPNVGSNMLENMIIKSMKDDVSKSKRKSRLWLVNVGMRWVKLFEANSADKPEVTYKPIRPSLQMRSLSSNGGLDISRSYNERKSNLASYLQRPESIYNEDENDISVSQRVIFSSNYYKYDDNIANERSLFVINDILTKITTSIDSFISAVNYPDMNGCVDILKLEQLCCDNIRALIDELLSSF